MIHRVRVIFGDTDQMGVVYYANYLRYFESARAALLRALGHSYRDFEAWGVALPVVEAHCRYRRPAAYEDLLDVRIAIAEVRGASVRFTYEVEREGALLCDGFTRHAVVDGAGRPRSMPPPMRDLVARLAREPRDRVIP